jgi:hypothetical protein
MSAHRNWRSRAIVVVAASLLAFGGATAAPPGRDVNGNFGGVIGGRIGAGDQAHGDTVRASLGYPSSPSCGGELLYPDTSRIADAGDAVKAVSRVASNYLKACDCPTTSCLADVLDGYASELAKVAPRLPEQLRDMPEVVAAAAHQLRRTRSKVEAQAILDRAISHIRKEIALLRVDDADKPQRLTRSGDFVVGDLGVARETLQRANAI